MTKRWNEPKNIKVDTVQLNTLLDCECGYLEGRMQWNVADGTFEFCLPGGEVKLQIGQEQLVLCKNKQGSNIKNGNVVYVSGAKDLRPKIKLADNNTGDPTQAWALGLATEDIRRNRFGYVTTFGLVRDIDTSMFSNGDFLWVSDVPGVLTHIRPAAPKINVFMGMCIYSHETEGIIFARPIVIPRLVGLSDVHETIPNDGDILVWVAANNRFELQAP